MKFHWFAEVTYGHLEKDFPLRMAHQVVSAKVKGAPVP